MQCIDSPRTGLRQEAKLLPSRSCPQPHPTTLIAQSQPRLQKDKTSASASASALADSHAVRFRTTELSKPHDEVALLDERAANMEYNTSKVGEDFEEDLGEQRSGEEDLGEADSGEETESHLDKDDSGEEEVDEEDSGEEDVDEEDVVEDLYPEPCATDLIAIIALLKQQDNAENEQWRKKQAIRKLEMFVESLKEMEDYETML